ncbi:hypothetical protein TNCV_1017451 [Trichonephila clavipes]|uniref:Uncharacterized protein n=1 Tax=Trichonephila clavipes TaxID=2585209 RepID=A0A8X6VYD5_TRICX|nr:hypothetical protein TNCV_1017451 [Trichonephila clavipes]
MWDPLVFSEHDFATDHEVVGDEFENNRANPLTLRREARESEKGVKILKLSSGWPKSIKSRPNSPVASTSKEDVIRCPACEEEYCDPPTEE